MRCGTPRSGIAAPSAKGAATGRRHSRAAIQPPCFCANSFASLRLPRGGVHAKRVAAGLTVAANADEVDRPVEHDLDRLRFAWSPVEKRAQRHGRQTTQPLGWNTAISGGPLVEKTMRPPRG